MSVKTLDQVIAYATQKGIPVFTIYYIDPNLNGGTYGNTEVLQRMAKETGGQYLNSNTADLTTLFQQISNVLSNKYTITYTPTTCSSGSTVTLDVSVDDGISLHGQNSTKVSFP